MIRLRWYVARLKLLWTFVKMIPNARALELEWQQSQQKRNDFEFGGPYQREDFLYQKGFCDGIKYCTKFLGD